MSYSPKQWRAIRSWLEKNNYRPQLSAFPVVRATNKAGEVIEMHITNIELFYEGERARAKRTAQEEKKAKK